MKMKIIYFFFGFFLALFVISNIIIEISPTAKAGTIDVGPGQTYTTIQEGIDAANPGDTVYVHEGIYYETVVINKSINLTGENKETTIIDGMGNFIVVFIDLEIHYVNITGFTIRNGDNGIWAAPSNYTRIYGNIICNITDEGIELITGFNRTITDNTIYNTTWGIFSGDLDNCSITNNNIYGNGVGIDLTCFNSFVSKNEVHGNTFSGISVSRSNNTVYNNNIYSNPGRGIFLTDDWNKIINNRIFNNTAGGIEITIWTNNNVIIDNSIENSEYGVFIRNFPSNNSFINNVIQNSSKYGIYALNSDENNYFINCTIINSSGFDIQIEKANITFLNTSFNNKKVNFIDNSSTLTVQWYMHAFVKDIGNNPILNTTIEVNNITDDLIANGKTNDDGMLRWIVVTERIQNYSTNITHTPHNVTALKDSYIGYAIPEPIMDISKQVNITLLIPQPLHHIEIIPIGLESYYIGDSITYTAIGWNDAAETQMNLTWTPLWSVDNTSIAIIDPGTGFFTTTALGSSAVNATSSTPTGIYTISLFTVEPWPLHHISISPGGLETYYIGDMQTYTAIGYNDAAETQINTTWTPVWSVDNTSIASINPLTVEFTALALGSSIVNVTDSTVLGIYNTSLFVIEPWPLHHVVIDPSGPKRYYIGDEITYTAIGWNDAAETQQNMTWVPVWNVDNVSLATIDSALGGFMAIALGSGAVNVTSTAPIGIYNMSSFVVEPWSLHHINITPIGPEYYYVSDTRTYTALGWNDAEETQMNYTWIPVWNVNDTSLASINSTTGVFAALDLGSGRVNVSDLSSTRINSSSFFRVDPWPLDHIEISALWAEDHYFVYEMGAYSAYGWNDVNETQINNTWIPVWRVENSTLGRILGGSFIADAPGTSMINVSCETQPDIYAARAFTVYPWSLHHIQIVPAYPQTYTVGDILSYSAIGWNDVEETQMNTTWTPVWSLEGDIQKITWEGEEARFEAKKTGLGLIKCTDEDTGIFTSSEIVVKEKKQEEIPLTLWIMFIIVIISICLVIFLFLYWKKVRKNEKGER